MLWRRQPLTRQGPLASSGRRNRARADTGYRPEPATLLTARQVTPLNSRPAALPERPTRSWTATRATRVFVAACDDGHETCCKTGPPAREGRAYDIRDDPKH